MIEYDLIRENRRSITIIIEKGTVIVKAPKSVPLEKIEFFLNSKKDWIIKKSDKYFKNYHKYKDVFDLSGTRILGQHFDVMQSEECKTPGIVNNYFVIPAKYFNKDIKTGIIKALKKIAQDYLIQRIEFLSLKSGLNYTKVSLSNAKTRWGSCTSENEIKLNWRLILLKKEIIDYVIIHELCHTEYHDHSNKYWSFVESYLPDYKSKRNQLKNDSIIIELYR